MPFAANTHKHARPLAEPSFIGAMAEKLQASLHSASQAIKHRISEGAGKGAREAEAG